MAFVRGIGYTGILLLVLFAAMFQIDAKMAMPLNIILDTVVGGLVFVATVKVHGWGRK